MHTSAHPIITAAATMLNDVEMFQRKKKEVETEIEHIKGAIYVCKDHKVVFQETVDEMALLIKANTFLVQGLGEQWVKSTLASKHLLKLASEVTSNKGDVAQTLGEIDKLTSKHIEILTALKEKCKKIHSYRQTRDNAGTKKTALGVKEKELGELLKTKNKRLQCFEDLMPVLAVPVAAALAVPLAAEAHGTKRKIE